MQRLSKEQSEELNNAISGMEESAAQLAERFGIGRNAVYLRAKKLGVKLPSGGGGGVREEAEEDAAEDGYEEPEQDAEEQSYSLADVLKAAGYLLSSIGNLIEK